jgi:hypothetical protein
MTLQVGDALHTCADLGQCVLQASKWYTVTRIVSDTCVELKEHPGLIWSLLCFDILGGDIGRMTIVGNFVAGPPVTGASDPAETRAWANARPKVAPNECPKCWAPLPCRYHD